MMTILRLLVMLSVVVAPVVALGQPVSPIPANDADFRVGAEVFPIFPWDTLPARASAYAEARAAGFNLAGFVRPENLDLVAAAGLKAFVSDPAVIKIRGNEKASDEAIEAAVKSLTDKTAKHPATFGYHVIDEPAAALVPQVVRWTNALQAAAPDAVVYTNFLPVRANAATRPAVAEGYADYLGKYLDAVRPAAKAFSYDHYSLLDDGSLRPTWFINLEVARRVSLAHHVPFWNVILACSHFRYIDPSPASLRFQVYTSLAYGARGIGYFTFSDRDRGNYRDAAIDLFGHRTPTFDMVRQINLQLHRLAPVVTKLTSVGVFHHPEVPAGCVGIGASKFLKDVRGKGPFCVGEFEDEEGKPAVMVVNCDRVHSTQVTIVPKARTGVQRVSGFTGQTRPWGAEDNWLPPGGGILLRLKD